MRGGKKTRKSRVQCAAALVAAACWAWMPSASFAEGLGHRQQYYVPCPCPQAATAPATPATPAVPPGQAQPGQTQPGQAQPGQTQPGQAQPGQAQPGQAQQPQQPAQPQQPTPDYFNQPQAQTLAQTSAAPNMIGDFFGGGGAMQASAYDPHTSQSVYYQVPDPSKGGSVGRLKIAENTSPLPQDRLLFNYSFFSGTSIGADVSRFTFGAEKTFWDGMASIEIKAPMAQTLSSNIPDPSAPDFSHSEFGNLMITPKVILLDRDTWKLTGGVSLTLPTADDTRWGDLTIENESVFLSPFFGLVWTPNDRFFAQAILQYDVDLTGSPITGAGPDYTQLNGTTWQWLDVGAGVWVIDNTGYSNRLQKMAVVGEFHWNQSLNDRDWIGEPVTNVSIVDLTIGAHFLMRNNTTVTAGYAFPIGNSSDQQFNGEFRLMVNKFFGQTARPETGAF